MSVSVKINKTHSSETRWGGPACQTRGPLHERTAHAVMDATTSCLIHMQTCTGPNAHSRVRTCRCTCTCTCAGDTKVHYKWASQKWMPSPTDKHMHIYTLYMDPSVHRTTVGAEASDSSEHRVSERTTHADMHRSECTLESAQMHMRTRR